MILAQLNLPLYDNKGKSVKKIHKQLEVELCSKFGGCTTSSGRGKWLEKGKLYNDIINIYQVAIDKRLKNMFVKIAKKYGVETKQLAIYLVIEGQVKIINL